MNEASNKREELQIISERIDPAPGTHTITYKSDIDDIEIKHTAHTREGFAKEDRGFRPHLTIARLRRPEDARQLAEAHIQTKFDSIEVPVNEFVLFRSDLSPKGSIYTVISKHAFI